MLKQRPRDSNLNSNVTGSRISLNNPFRLSHRDIPEEGESLFDWVIHSSHNPQPGIVPFPFSNLQQLIETIPGVPTKVGARNARTVPILVPIGRSLQRFAADPFYFRYPRILLAADTVSETSNSPSLAGKLFVAYAERANQLEVISFNDAMGRFEFQIVRNYGPGVQPEIYYAHRDACVACHAGRVAIFPDFPWLETNSTIEIAAAIEKDTGPEYLGIKVKQRRMVEGQFNTADTGADFDTESLAFEELVRRGSGLAHAHELWHQLSLGINPATRARTMAKALGLGIVNNLSYLTPKQRADLEKEVLNELLENGTKTFDWLDMKSAFDGVALGSESVLPLARKSNKQPNNIQHDPSPERTFLYNSAEGLKESVFEATQVSLEHLLNSPIYDSYYLNPLGNLLDKHINEKLANDAMNHFRNSSAHSSVLTLLASVGSLCDTKPKCSMQQPLFNTNQFLSEVNQVLGQQVFKINPEPASSKSTRKVLDPFHSVLPDQIAHPELKLVVTYCGRCHSNREDGPKQSFLYGVNEHAVLKQLKPRKRDALLRLQGKGTNPMPPFGSLEADILRTYPSHSKLLETFLSKDIN